MGEGVDYKRKVYAIRDLPTLPAIAQKVLSIADDDESIKKLTELISSDQSLSLKILGLANSAYFGHRAKIGTLHQAVMIIGTAMLKQLSLSVLVYDAMGYRGRDRTHFWKHSFATATAASLIAKRTGMPDAELAFMAGLLHDVGKIIIDTHFPNDPGIEHTLVGGWMAERWELPPCLVKAITCHHSTSLECFTEPIVTCVHAANTCAKLALNKTAPPVQPEVLDTLGLSEAEFQAIQRELQDRQSQMDSLLR